MKKQRDEERTKQILRVVPSLGSSPGIGTERINCYLFPEAGRLVHLSICRFACLLICSFAHLLICSCRPQPSAVTSAELHARLQPLETIETYAGFDGKHHRLYFGNLFIERQIDLDRDSKPIRTVGYRHKPSRKNYVNGPSEEFRFRIGAVQFSGDSPTLKYDTYQTEKRFNGSRHVSIKLTYTARADAMWGVRRDVETREEARRRGGEGAGQISTPARPHAPSNKESKEIIPIFHLWLHYEIYPEHPIVYKWLSIHNLTDFAFSLEDIAIESLPFFGQIEENLYFGPRDVEADPISSQWMEETSQASPGSARSNAIVMMHDADNNRGIVFGNESPGVLKYHEVDSERQAFLMGLASTASSHHATLLVPPNQHVRTPKVWTMLFEGSRGGVHQTLPPPTMASMPQTSSVVWIPVNGSLPHLDNFTVVDYNWNWEDLTELDGIGQKVHHEGGKLGIRIPIAAINAAFLDRPTWQLMPTNTLQVFQLNTNPNPQADTSNAYKYGLIFLQSGIQHANEMNLNEAIQDLKIALQLGLSEADQILAFYYLALMYKSDGIIDKAEAYLEEILERHPGYRVPTELTGTDLDEILQQVKAKMSLTQPASPSAESEETLTPEQEFIYCVLSDYGGYLYEAVKALLKKTEADLLIFDRPIIGIPDSLLKGCGVLAHGHGDGDGCIWLMYRWLFEFADDLHRSHPDLKLGITSTAYGVKHPDLACFEHFDLFVQECQNEENP